MNVVAASQAFAVAFDGLHRELRLVLREPNATFDACIESLARGRQCGRDDIAFLDRCRSIRNFLSHNNDLLALGMVGISVEAAAVLRLTSLRDRFAKRLVASRFMVPFARVLTGRVIDALEPLMRTMVERDFTHLPIVENGRVAAVLDERVMFRALASDALDEVTPRTLIGDVIRHFAFAAIEPGTLGVMFAPRTASLADLRGGLVAHARAAERISLVIVTASGRADEPPLGILTVWDLPILEA